MSVHKACMPRNIGSSFICIKNSVVACTSTIGKPNATAHGEQAQQNSDIHAARASHAHQLEVKSQRS